MKYGERLVRARKHKALTQVELAERSGASQQTISYLENGEATGSEFTVQFAEACGVRPEWLAMEKGDMVDGIVIEGERLKHLFMVCEKLPDYAVDQLVQQGDAIAELIDRARKNGTEHGK